MRRQRAFLAVLFFLVVYLAVPAQIMAAAMEEKIMIYDDAKLLTPEEYQELNKMANQYGAKRETDIIIITSNNAKNVDVKKMTENFYDEHGPGYDKPHGNTVILTLDMRNRDVYLAGFYKAEQYLGDGRLDKIRGKITSELSSGDYKQAFEKYIKTSYTYMGFKPGVNPDNILFNLWFQLGGALAIGGIAVGMMAYRSGGRITVNRQTYEDASNSGILDRQDQYIRTTVTRQKIEKSSGSKSGGGGGITGGGHSHSGSRGKF
ncbi:TPM domain-containing protein [Paenibacillus radicis (ex Xue et al. 2023)]|uniref:TPM domain-containing protein n=1 Tax=Paenibacillus radicis (ex Xue et al. 2023) TaxID=2972489 RepID=A0ABT1YN08_9BACL|nr:TPM domain-containing protein [Paenibacillus radicis (ex Xue et al. 2023)]MCR8633673.1 TPM domain-containing protein [Paenibacillus radicis (ex Xue et al. 2023)]